MLPYARSHMLGPARSSIRWEWAGIIVAFVLLITLYRLLTTASFPQITSAWSNHFTPSTTKPFASHDLPDSENVSNPDKAAALQPGSPSSRLHLPQDYYPQKRKPDWCEARFGFDYLNSIRQNDEAYCQRGSLSTMDCFRVDFGNGKKVDPFCVLDNVVADNGTFQLDCKLSEESKAKVADFPEYMWWTGPSKILDKHFHVDSNDEIQQQLKHLQCFKGDERKAVQKTAVLVLRGGGGNMWNSLMEIFSYYLSMDALSMILDRHGDMYFREQHDGNDLQVLWTDHKPAGPYAKLWDLWSSKPATHLSDFDPASTCFDRVVIPLPGGSNPMWQGDWVPHNCRKAPLLEVFRDRVLRFLQIAEPEKSNNLTVTIIHRNRTRQLKDEEYYLSLISARYPRINFQTMDLKATTFEQQLTVLRSTNVLVGTHGAGLTGMLFLPPRSSVVELIPPKVFHKGFRNLASLTDHRYFSTHGTYHEGDRDGWRKMPISVEEERFVEIMDLAIKSSYNTGTMNEDVN